VDFTVGCLLHAPAERVSREIQSMLSLAQCALTQSLLSGGGSTIHLIDYSGDPATIAVNRDVLSVSNREPHIVITLEIIVAAVASCFRWVLLSNQNTLSESHAGDDDPLLASLF
jgi:hypothetical protein